MSHEQIEILDRLVEEGVLERKEVIDLGPHHVYAVTSCTREMDHIGQGGLQTAFCTGCEWTVLDTRTGQEARPTHAVYTARIRLKEAAA